MTSVSEQCSRVIVEEKVMAVLHDYISHTNRNRASLEVVKVCLQILINITKVIKGFPPHVFQKHLCLVKLGGRGGANGS